MPILRLRWRGGELQCQTGPNKYGPESSGLRFESHQDQDIDKHLDPPFLV